MEEKENQVVTVNLEDLKALLTKPAEPDNNVPVSATMEIDFVEIVRALVRRWWLILVSVLLCGGIALIFFFATYTPKYKAIGKMYVNNKASLGSTSISLSDMSASLSLIDTYNAILKTRKTLREVCNELKKNYGFILSYDEIVGKISVGSVDETQVFYISAEDQYPERAIAIVNTIIDVLPIQISSIIEGSSVKTVDMAEVATPVSSNMVVYVALGALIGAVVSCAYIVLVDCVFNDKIEESEWLKTAYPDIPILAEIPDEDARNRTGKYYRSEYYRNHYASAYSSKNGKDK